MRILVLGSTGFLGRNLANYFNKDGNELHLVRLTRPEYEMEGATWHQVDLRIAPVVEALFDHVQPDVVLQMAAGTSGVKDTIEDPAMHTRNNAVINSEIFRAAYKAKVKHVIFPSCSVMYPSSATPLKETDFDANAPLNPKYIGFASTKIYCEKLCEFYAGIGETRFTAMRNTNFYGPFDKFDLERSHVFGATVTKVMSAGKEIIPQPEMSTYEVSQRLLDANTIKVWGTGEESRDFVHIYDFCRFVELAIEKQTTKYELYNCGSGIAVSVNDLVKAIINHSGKQIVIEHDLTKPTIPTSLCLDTSKAKAELGWEPKVSLYEGITTTLDWWKANAIG